MSVNQDTLKEFNFKAWVERNNSSETGSYKLHVHGEIQVEDETLFYQLDKKELQGYFPEELMLVIKPDPKPGVHKVELKYHEDLKDRNDYKQISISANNDQLTEVKEISEGP
ncbi:MAG: hypothetical protein WKF97_02335 [Chitinophagaceae bacterium]